MVTTLDKFGRVVIPKALRDSLGLKPGEPLEVEGEGQRILLKPVKEHYSVVRKGKVWVLVGGTWEGGTEDVVQRVREERDRTVSGPGAR
jgi:AbrB family looped-hinge helix DNA binding protein